MGGPPTLAGSAFGAPLCPWPGHSGNVPAPSPAAGRVRDPRQVQYGAPLEIGAQGRGWGSLFSPCQGLHTVLTCPLPGPASSSTPLAASSPERSPAGAGGIAPKTLPSRVSPMHPHRRALHPQKAPRQPSRCCQQIACPQHPDQAPTYFPARGPKPPPPPPPPRARPARSGPARAAESVPVRGHAGSAGARASSTRSLGGVVPSLGAWLMVILG